MDRRAGATWCRKLMLVHVVLAATNASLLFLVHRQLSATTAMRESVETNLRDDTLVLAARLQGVEEREHHVFKREELLGAEERLVAERGQFYRRAVQDRDFLAGTFASARVRAVYDRQLAWIGDRRARCPGAVTGNATARDAVDAEITQLLSAAPRSCGGARFLQCPSPDELEQCGTVCALQQTLYCFFVAIAVGRVPLPDASLVCSDVKNGSCLVGRVPCAPPANASIPARQWNIQRETKGSYHANRVLRATQKVTACCACRRMIDRTRCSAVLCLGRRRTSRWWRMRRFGCTRHTANCRCPSRWRSSCTSDTCCAGCWCHTLSTKSTSVMTSVPWLLWHTRSQRSWSPQTRQARGGTL
eukprot:TRINITY_DN3506_c0_g1_i3.p1 TRINITY_DN3506_c0_g1~~TRINITY_DN3506_c0_g1_i3.p1  ORF type:complete len:360 (+),score=29.00 TRINITY_DN3506_c0_g1_i3:29-1108(+)